MAPFRIAILWRGDREARRTASAQNNRYHRIFEELSGLGIHAEPAVYDEEFADEVCEQLLKVDGVLVWVDPLSRGKTRALLDPMLRDVTPKEFVDGKPSERALNTARAILVGSLPFSGTSSTGSGPIPEVVEEGDAVCLGPHSDRSAAHDMIVRHLDVGLAVQDYAHVLSGELHA